MQMLGGSQSILLPIHLIYSTDSEENAAQALQLPGPTASEFNLYL